MSKKFNKFYRINQYIQAEKVRVIDEQGKQMDVMSLAQALQKAAETKKDLVEVAPKAVPPVCKIIDFKKFKYQEAKKEQEEKKRSKRTELKEIRLGLFMAENDLNFRLNHAEKFLKEGHKVKISLRLKGREITKKDLGLNLINRAVEKIIPFGKVEVEPKFLGKQIELILTPLKVKGEKKEKNEEEKNEN